MAVASIFFEETQVFDDLTEKFEKCVLGVSIRIGVRRDYVCQKRQVMTQHLSKSW